MIKTNLPVILLKGIVLLPNNDVRLEFDNNISKNIIDVSELFHDNNILVVSQRNPLEEVLDIDELPRYGVVSKIIHKMELPNGKTRVIIRGKSRAKVYEYLKLNKSTDIIESILTSPEKQDIDSQKEAVLIRKLYRDMEEYIKSVPYISNSVLSLINNVKDLSKMTDIIAPHLPIDLVRLHEYLCTFDVITRTNMILEDVYKEKEMYDIEKKLELKVKKEIDNNQKEYLLREKMKAIKEELGDTAARDDEITKIREKINNLDTSDKIKERLKLELKRYEGLSQSSPEVNVIRNYIDWLLYLPWNKKTVDNNDLKFVKNKLDESHYGLDKVKTRIIEFLAVKQMSNGLRSPIICLVGPPGVGKTSLAFSIAAAINRKFVKMSVGGVNDEAEIKGHRRTYLGASPGRIIQSLKKAKSSNPLFLIDEIDKMTKDFKGDPASSLLEILDPEQNKFFSDNYIEEEYDLSSVMFVATANHVDSIPPALRDRLEIVHLSGYTEFEKLDIAKKHLIPKTCKEHGIETSEVRINDNIVLNVIRNYTREAGVRELERQLATIIRKIVTEMIVENKIDQKYIVNKKDLQSYLGKQKYHYNTLMASKVGVANGLAFTHFGGDTLPIEVNYYKGKGDLVLTGSLGEVMKESAQIALSYIKSNHKQYSIDYEKLVKYDIHIHVPEGSIPKDGPSAGIALTSALISAFTGKKIPASIAMTGEITLRGNVLPIGGLKEKSIGAHRNGIKKIIFPHGNMNDLDEIPKEIRDSIKYLPVKNYKEVMKFISE